MEPGDKLDEIVWDCIWIDEECLCCPFYHVLHKGLLPPKCPRRKMQTFRVLWVTEEQRIHIDKISKSLEEEYKTRFGPKAARFKR